jgi:hypothetical protein
MMNVYKAYNTLAFKYKDDAVASVALEESFQIFTSHLAQLLKQMQGRKESVR